LDRQRSQENPGNVASGSSNSGGYSNNGGGYRDRDTHQPGNNAGGYKRKGGGGGKQQRGPRSFVGPMDHSYRAVNGNFAEAPPSTIDAGYGRSNGHGRGYQSDSQPIDYSQGRAIPIPEDAPTKIFFFIEDLFFIAKISETARKLGVKVAFVKNEKDAVTALTAGEEEDRPGLIVFDLNNANAKPLTLIPKLKAKLKRSTSIIGFLSHLQGDLKAKAVEAGCDTVMPRAAFSQNLPNLLRRYGIEQEEEPNFNQ
jgi:CheY-like chemotaxis protein